MKQSNHEGLHYNPYNVTHGAPFATIRHVGDLGNINANSSGNDSIILFYYFFSESNSFRLLD